MDGGITSIRSPSFTLPTEGALTLSFYDYLAHSVNSSADDYLRVKVVGSNTSLVFEELGEADDDNATWALAIVSLNAFAGQTVYLLVEAANGASASLDEAANDDVRIVNRNVL